MKLCKVCKQEKVYDPLGATPKDKGFMGKICWGCFVRAQRLRYYGINVLEPSQADLILEKQLQEMKLQRRKHNAQVAAERAAWAAERTLHKFSPEVLERERAKILAADRLREEKHEAWVAQQRAKNQRKLAAYDRKHNIAPRDA